MFMVGERGLVASSGINQFGIYKVSMFMNLSVLWGFFPLGIEQLP